jgi:hypothetical protein
MFGLDPRILALLCVGFIALGIYNIIKGRKQLLQTQSRGQRAVWYKQISILTGTEYILLSLAFLTSLSITYRWLPASFQPVVAPFYLLVLFGSAILAGVVIYQGFNKSRNQRPAPRGREEKSASVVVEHEPQEMTPEERAAYMRKRRERRQKAAAARRRRAGKA